MASVSTGAGLAACFEALRLREAPGGGFPESPGGEYRPDATAWAILALSRQSGPAALSRARGRLAADQLPDGRVCVTPEQPRAIWPTAPAILAWAAEPELASQRTRAIAFLLAAAGESWPAAANAGIGHDTSLRGWPWIEGTHSWVEPTALALLALRSAGHAGHPRYAEGANLLLDRQLPHGGWNYGNTTGFGRELRPTVDATGLALTALGGAAARNEVERSLTYLRRRIENVRAPLSLGWALRGLDAWRERPAAAGAMIRESLERQAVTGEYPTSALALLALADGGEEARP